MPPARRRPASSALALIFAYPEFEQQNLALSRLAREEFATLRAGYASAARPAGTLSGGCARRAYAGSLRALIAAREPQRRIDLLLTAALIEARSCERFQLLAKTAAATPWTFYAELEPVESRHAQLYLRWAEAGRRFASGTGRAACAFSAAEAELITTAEGSAAVSLRTPRTQILEPVARAVPDKTAPLLIPRRRARYDVAVAPSSVSSWIAGRWVCPCTSRRVPQARIAAPRPLRSRP